MTDYWKNRFIKSTKDVFDSDEEYVKEIFKIYESTIEDLDSEIFKLLNSMEDVSMAEAKKLLNKYEIRSFKSGLDEFRKASKGFISPDVEKELDIVSRRVRISRLQAMQVSMKSKVATLLNKEQKKLFAHLSNKFTSSYYKDLYELQRITGYKNINSLSKDFVNNILNTSWTNDGENFSDRIWKRKDKLLNTLDTELRQGLITGKKPDEITKVISDKLKVSKSNAKRLVLTESSAIHSQSRKAMYERMGVEKYEVVATLDLRTSDICRKLDGKVFDVKDYERGVTAPPYHVYCRSTTVPYYDDDIQTEIENTRMARDPETEKSLRVEDLTYKEWYKKYVEKLPNNNQEGDTPNVPKEQILKYTEAETKEAIEEYVSGDGMWINNKLRGIGEIADYPLNEDDKIYLEKLDQATQSQIVKEKTLYRSVDISSIIGDISDFEYDDLKSAYIYNNKSKPAQEAINKYLKNIEGKEIVDKGFISTTKDKEIALDFQDFTGSSKPCVIEFNVPNGVHGIDLKEFDIADMEQKEVLLARNQKFVIREVRQEQGQFYFKADLLTEKVYNDNVIDYVSGAITDSYSKEARNHAQLYYEEIRKQKTDIDRISKNTGYDKKLIEEIKNYLFYDEHDIYGIKKRFDPDFSIAQSWQRLAQDEMEQHDLTLINHEIMERRLIAKGLTQDEAHKIASKKYNYRKESSEYYAKIKKRRKKE